MILNTTSLLPMFWLNKKKQITATPIIVKDIGSKIDFLFSRFLFTTYQWPLQTQLFLYAEYHFVLVQLAILVEHTCNLAAAPSPRPPKPFPAVNDFVETSTEWPPATTSPPSTTPPKLRESLPDLNLPSIKPKLLDPPTPANNPGPNFTHVKIAPVISHYHCPVQPLFFPALWQYLQQLLDHDLMPLYTISRPYADLYEHHYPLNT